MPIKLIAKKKKIKTITNKLQSPFWIGKVLECKLRDEVKTRKTWKAGEGRVIENWKRRVEERRRGWVVSSPHKQLSERGLVLDLFRRFITIGSSGEREGPRQLEGGLLGERLEGQMMRRERRRGRGGVPTRIVGQFERVQVLQVRPAALSRLLLVARGGLGSTVAAWRLWHRRLVLRFRQLLGHLLLVILGLLLLSVLVLVVLRVVVAVPRQRPSHPACLAHGPPDACHTTIATHITTLINLSSSLIHSHRNFFFFYKIF